jgi:hypothetical protein
MTIYFVLKVHITRLIIRMHYNGKKHTIYIWLTRIAHMLKTDALAADIFMSYIINYIHQS